MRVRLWIKASMIVAIVAALCMAWLSAAARQQDSSQQRTGDPVADAARKAREKKKDAPKPKKIYTDDDVKKSAPEPAPGVAGGTVDATAVQAAGGPAKTGDATKTEDPNGQAAWRRRFQAQRDKIAKLMKELDILGRELEKAQMAYYPDPQKAMTQQNSRTEINAINAKIDAKKKEVAELQQGLDDMEEQLRKSGGDPGWAR